MKNETNENNNEYIYWSEKSSSLNNYKKAKIIFGFSNGRIIDKVYFFHDSILYLSNGDVFKEGTLPFEPKSEKNKNKNERILVNLKRNNISFTTPINQLSFGKNHILMLSSQGYVFSWGENYYGQLGLKKGHFLSVMNEPTMITTMESSVEYILAYENTSFFINTLKKMYGCGEHKNLGINLKTNLFVPQLLSAYNVYSLKVNNGTFFAKIAKYHEVSSEIKIVNVEKENIKEKKATTENIKLIEDEDSIKYLNLVNSTVNIVNQQISKISNFDFTFNYINEMVLK